ncbi:uncharacterized protein METZ01_LOCUS377288, partial [marine metagenome]
LLPTASAPTRSPNKRVSTSPTTARQAIHP